MSFSTDRDLVLFEPNVFVDVPMVSQQRIEVVDGVVSGTTLTSVSADFVLAQVDTGGVVLISGVTHEVVSRIDANTLVISLPRTSPSDTPIPSTDGSGLKVIGRTFSPQAMLAHNELLRLVGIEADDPASVLTEQSIISLSVMSHLEVLGTLQRVYSAAASLTGDNTEVGAKAKEYEHRFNAACRSATILLDLDGDGYADVNRGLGVKWFHRA